MQKPDTTNEVPVITSDLLSKAGGVRHAFSTRSGGVSIGGCASMNLSFTRKNDVRSNVEENYARICRTLGASTDRLVMSWQVHEDGVMAVDETHAGQGWDENPPQADALITNAPNILLSKIYADCVPVFLYDPVARAIGLAHAGWRGTTMRIAGKTVTAMREHYGCRPQDILAFIGPSIGPCHFEVDEPVVEAFHKAYPDHAFYESAAKVNQGKYLLDLWAYNRACLLNCDIMPEHIEIAGLCTYCHEDTFFSHRRDHGENGLMAGLLMLEP